LRPAVGMMNQPRRGIASHESTARGHGCTWINSQ